MSPARSASPQLLFTLQWLYSSSKCLKALVAFISTQCLRYDTFTTQSVILPSLYPPHSSSCPPNLPRYPSTTTDLGASPGLVVFSAPTDVADLRTHAIILHHILVANRSQHTHAHVAKRAINPHPQRHPRPQSRVGTSRISHHDRGSRKTI